MDWKYNIQFKLFFSKHTYRYSDLQTEFEEMYSSMQDFFKSEDFRTHIKNKGYGLEKLEERLSLMKNDTRKTESSIVIAGEHI